MHNTMRNAEDARNRMIYRLYHLDAEDEEGEEKTPSRERNGSGIGTTPKKHTGREHHGNWQINRIAYGLLAGAGIDTRGMEPREAWDTLRQTFGINMREAVKELQKNGNTDNLKKKMKEKGKEQSGTSSNETSPSIEASTVSKEPERASTKQSVKKTNAKEFVSSLHKKIKSKYQEIFQANGGNYTDTGRECNELESDAFERYRDEEMKFQKQKPSDEAKEIWDFALAKYSDPSNMLYKEDDDPEKKVTIPMEHLINADFFNELGDAVEKCDDINEWYKKRAEIYEKYSDVKDFDAPDSNKINKAKNVVRNFFGELKKRYPDWDEKELDNHIEKYISNNPYDLRGLEKGKLGFSVSSGENRDSWNDLTGKVNKAVKGMSLAEKELFKIGVYREYSKALEKAGKSEIKNMEELEEFQSRFFDKYIDATNQERWHSRIERNKMLSAAAEKSKFGRMGYWSVWE